MQLNGSRQRFEDSGLSRNRPPQQSGILGENGNQPERLLDSRLRLAIEYVLDEHLVLLEVPRTKGSVYRGAWELRVIAV